MSHEVANEKSAAFAASFLCIKSLVLLIHKNDAAEREPPFGRT